MAKTKGFDLGAMLKDVSKLDTNREQIEYISLGLIDKDPKNFYKLSDIKELADNIALCGLMDPIRVRPSPDRAGRYMIVSGHRRHSAIMEIKNEQPGLFEKVPCIIERAETTDAMRQLRLIYANSNTRSMTNAELGEQAEQVEKLLYELKEQGYEFPGRMRDHVAEACKVSKTKLARLKVIRENLFSDWQPSYREGKLVEATAYALAKMPAEWQHCIFEGYRGKDVRYVYEYTVQGYGDSFKRLSKIRCPDTMAPCEHIGTMRRCIVETARPYSNYCTGCCIDCLDLRTCKYSCQQAQDQKQALKDERKAQKAHEKWEREEKERPTIQYIQGVYERVGKIRRARKISTKQLFAAGHRYFPADGEKQETDLERGHCAISAYQNLPFGNCFRAEEAKAICAVADLLGCSVDYLLGRDVSDSDTWQIGTPVEAGEYVVICKYSPDAPEAVESVTWDGSAWDDKYILEDTKVLRWIKKPKGEK